MKFEILEELKLTQGRLKDILLTENELELIFDIFGLQHPRYLTEHRVQDWISGNYSFRYGYTDKYLITNTNQQTDNYAFPTKVFRRKRNFQRSLKRQKTRLALINIRY